MNEVKLREVWGEVLKLAGADDRRARLVTAFTCWPTLVEDLRRFPDYVRERTLTDLFVRLDLDPAAAQLAAACYDGWGPGNVGRAEALLKVYARGAEVAEGDPGDSRWERPWWGWWSTDELVKGLAYGLVYGRGGEPPLIRHQKLSERLYALLAASLTELSVGGLSPLEPLVWAAREGCVALGASEGVFYYGRQG